MIFFELTYRRLYSLTTGLPNHHNNFFLSNIHHSILYVLLKVFFTLLYTTKEVLLYVLLFTHPVIYFSLTDTQLFQKSTIIYVPSNNITG